MVNKKLIRPIIKVGLISDLQQILNTFGDLVGKCMHVFLSTVTLHIFKHSSLSSQTPGGHLYLKLDIIRVKKFT